MLAYLRRAVKNLWKDRLRDNQTQATLEMRWGYLWAPPQPPPQHKRDSLGESLSHEEVWAQPDPWDTYDPPGEDAGTLQGRGGYAHIRGTDTDTVFPLGDPAERLEHREERSMMTAMASEALRIVPSVVRRFVMDYYYGDGASVSVLAKRHKLSERAAWAALRQVTRDMVNTDLAAMWCYLQKIGVSYDRGNIDYGDETFAWLLLGSLGGAPWTRAA